MELTNNQVRQINNFLEAINIEYIDIRMEMVDHIASEIENEIEDIPSFFEDNRLQSTFLKYMLGRKKEFLTRYDSIVKQKLWSDIKLIIRDIFIQLKKPTHFLFLLCSSASTYFLIPFINPEYLIYLPYSYIIIISLHFNLLTYKFIKRYKELKIIHSYRYFIGFTTFPIMIIPSYFEIAAKFSFSDFFMVLSAISCGVYYLATCSFISRKKEFENKYQQLIN
ncbi:hypothetical protein [Tenacibaculum sp. 190524A02b]|uniref:DUF1700 domain-containing protein n=1 Tax=Tenacibaculum vairaonense TaxID=3137860 RepID=A0ABP1F9G3_9FLAO